MPTPLDTGLPPHPNFIFTPVAAAVTQTAMRAEAIQRIRLTITGAVLSITDALAYGSVLLGYVPDKNMVFIGGEADLSCVKDGAGILTSELPKIAFGTAAASNATLSSTMSNLINGGATAGTALASGLTATWRYHSNDNASAIPYVGIADTATTAIYLNASVNPTGDGTLTITGTVDLYFLMLGNNIS
jgi:hypothetical protein